MNRDAVLASVTVVLLIAFMAIVGVSSVAPADEAPATQPTTRATELGKLSELRKGPRVWENYNGMHDYFVQRFINSDGFGHERLVSVRTFSRMNALYVEGKSYDIGKVELVSLGNFDKSTGKPGDGAAAFAYASEQFDAMKETIRKAKHRDLSKDEAKALRQVMAGSESVLIRQKDIPVVMGRRGAGERKLPRMPQSEPRRPARRVQLSADRAQGE